MRLFRHLLSRRHRNADTRGSDITTGGAASCSSVSIRRLCVSVSPWEDIYTNDSERDQTFEEAVQVYQSCAQWHTTFGYSLIEVPKGTVSERVAFILERVGSWDG